MTLYRPALDFRVRWRLAWGLLTNRLTVEDLGACVQRGRAVFCKGTIYLREQD